MTDTLRTRRVRSGVALTTAALAMVATVGSATSASAAGKAPAAASGSVAAIAKLVPASYKKQGTLTVAVATYPPSAIQPATGALTGWDVENTRSILKVLGLKANFKVIAFAGVVPGLQSGRYDLAAGEIYIKPERTQVVTFVANHVSQDALLVAADSKLTSAPTEESLCGLTLTATSGSAEMDLANQIVADCAKAGKATTKVANFDTAAQMNLALTSGRADAEIGSASQVSYVAQQTGKQYRTIAVPWSTSYDTGLAISRTNKDYKKFAKAVEAATNYLIKNGTLQKILDKWNSGLGLMPKAKVEPAA